MKCNRVAMYEIQNKNQIHFYILATDSENDIKKTIPVTIMAKRIK